MSSKHYRLTTDRLSKIYKNSTIHKVYEAIEKHGPINSSRLAEIVGVGLSVIYNHTYTLHESVPQKIYVARWMLINSRHLQPEFAAGDLPDVPRPYGIAAAHRMLAAGSPHVRLAPKDHVTYSAHQETRRRTSGKTFVRVDETCKYTGPILTRFVGGINPWTKEKVSS